MDILRHPGPGCLDRPVSREGPFRREARLDGSVGLALGLEQGEMDARIEGQMLPEHKIIFQVQGGFMTEDPGFVRRLEMEGRIDDDLAVFRLPAHSREVLRDEGVAQVGIVVGVEQQVVDAGFADDATIFCVLSFDSTEPGSRDAYSAVSRELRQIQLGNNQFSYTEIDRAVPEEETT